MASKLYPPGVRLTDTADILANDNYVVTALNATAGTLAAGIITGGSVTVCITTNATPGTQTTRTAAQMYGDDPGAAIGGGYLLRIANSGAGCDDHECGAWDLHLMRRALLSSTCLTSFAVEVRAYLNGAYSSAR